VELEGLRITPVPVHHAVPTFGFLVEDAAGAVAFSSDTGPTDELWARAGARANLRAVFLEASFPDALGWLAEASGHLTPARFAAELRKLPRPVPAIAVHIKPRYREQVVKELLALGQPELQIGRFGVPYEF
jgi:ribonuclease BN (tRNA processing enzyme)